MNIFVIHGDNEVKARSRLETLLSAARKKGLNIQRITSGESLFEGGLSSQGLFGENLILIENPGKLSKKDLDVLYENKGAIGNIIFFHSGFLAKSFLEQVPQGSKIEEYKLPRVIYKFLDSFYPNNSKLALTLLHGSLKKEPSELLLHLLSKHLRDLYVLKLNPKLLNYPDWRFLKLTSIAGKFSLTKLKTLIKKLAKVDVLIKTSKEDLISSLDLLIATELE